jgi:hypothetical protein
LYYPSSPFYRVGSSKHYGASLLVPSVLRSEKRSTDDETLALINKPKQPKRGKTRNRMEGPTMKKTKEPSKMVNHKGNIKFLNPLLSVRSISNRERRGPL